MNPFLKRVLGIVYAEQDDNEIRLRGIHASTVARDMMKIWATSRIEQHMFKRITSNLISFPLFFAPDVHYILKTLLANKKSWTNINAIRKALHELETNTWLKNLVEEPKKFLDRSKLSVFKKTPLPHQTEFFDVYEDRKVRYGLNGYLLSAAAGSGKTLTNLMLAEMAHAQYVFMVVPKNSVYRVWSKTLNEEYDKPQAHWIAADGKPYKGERFIIGHYETLDQMISIAHQCHGKIVVVLDESHNMNEMTSQRTKLFIDLCAATKCEDVLWSSGTPVKALGYETIPLLRTIDPLFTVDVEERFKKIFGRDSKRALDILRNRMGMISYRVEKAEVMNNHAQSRQLRVKIPNGDAYTLETIKREMATFIKERLEYYDKHMGKYEKIYDNALDWHEHSLETSVEKRAFSTYKSHVKMIRRYYDPKEMAKEAQYCNEYELGQIMPSLKQDMRADFKNCRAVIKYVHLKVMGEALGGVLGRKRSQCHVEMIKYLKLEDVVNTAMKKTVIFTSFVAVVKELGNYFQARKFHPILVHGETNSNLSGLIHEFEVNPEANPAIATYQSLSTAVPLTMANTAIFINQPFRDHEKVQAQARVDRLGQDTPVRFVDVILDTGDEPNISTRANDILEWSKAQVAAILGQEYGGAISKSLDIEYVGNEAMGMEEYFTAESNYEDEWTSEDAPSFECVIEDLGE